MKAIVAVDRNWAIGNKGRPQHYQTVVSRRGMKYLYSVHSYFHTSADQNQYYSVREQVPARAWRAGRPQHGRTARGAEKI